MSFIETNSPEVCVCDVCGNMVAVKLTETHERIHDNHDKVVDILERLSRISEAHNTSINALCDILEEV